MPREVLHVHAQLTQIIVFNPDNSPSRSHRLQSTRHLGGQPELASGDLSSGDNDIPPIYTFPLNFQPLHDNLAQILFGSLRTNCLPLCSSSWGSFPEAQWTPCTDLLEDVCMKLSTAHSQLSDGQLRPPAFGV